MKSLPATVNMVLYHGMRPNIKVEISDATKAYYIIKHPRTVKVLHLCFVGNYCQGFHDANFVYILISFMFSSCVDILSIGSSVLLKNPGRNDLASWFACLLKLHTMIHAFLGCISRCNHDFHFDIDRSKGTGTKMGCVVVTLKRKQLCTNQLYFLNTLPQKYHEFVQCWIFHWTQTWQTKYIPWVLCNNSFWTPNNLHIYFLGQQTCLRPVMACILQHRQCAHQNLSIGLIQHDISGCFSLIDDCLVRHGSSNVSHPRVFVVFCQAQNLLQTESQVDLWFLNQPFFHYSLPACLCHNDFQSSCTSWKDNKGYDQDQFLLWVFASNSQISAWILETRWLFQ
jgi:hypothetical protein